MLAGDEEDGPTPGAMNLAPTSHRAGDGEDGPSIITHKHAEPIGKENRQSPETHGTIG